MLYLALSIDSTLNLEKYVRLSFHPNNPMMYVALNEGRISQPMMLEIKLEVVSRPGVRFSDCNATRGDARQSTNPSIVRFDVVKSKKQADVCKDLQKFYQAEVLVPSPIPPHLIIQSKPVKVWKKENVPKQAKSEVKYSEPADTTPVAADVADGADVAGAADIADVAADIADVACTTQERKQVCCAS